MRAPEVLNIYAGCKQRAYKLRQNKWHHFRIIPIYVTHTHTIYTRISAVVCHLSLSESNLVVRSECIFLHLYYVDNSDVHIGDIRLYTKPEQLLRFPKLHIEHNITAYSFSIHRYFRGLSMYICIICFSLTNCARRLTVFHVCKRIPKCKSSYLALFLYRANCAYSILHRCKTSNSIVEITM